MKSEELETVNLSAARPPAEMTDDQWQEYFQKMKALVRPINERRMNYHNSSLTINGKRLKQQSTYSGETQWYRYCQYINSVLDAIRHNEHDYCYNIYQITDLLKYEHDRLSTKWLKDDACIEVWLS